MAAWLTTQGRLLFATRSIRMFAFGAVGVILALYLNTVGFSDPQIGVLLSCTLIGDAIISLAITLTADRFGRRRMLLLGCGLKLGGAAVFALTSTPQFALLLVAATVGILSPSGNEVGPFQALEQSMLSDQVAPAARTTTFAVYKLVGYLMTATGSLATGVLTVQLTSKGGLSALDAYRVTFAEYGGLALLTALITLLLGASVEAQAWQARRAAASADREAARQPLLASNDVEGQEGDDKAAAAAAALPQPGAGPQQASVLGLSARSRPIVIKLSLLFATDSFAGGLVTGTLLAYYFHVRFGVDTTYLGGLLFVSNVIAGLSSLAAGWVASKIGLINTMVFTHLPSNVLLMAVPLMPTLPLATAMVFARFSISQMDVAPRQSYVSGIVPAYERTATMGITNIVKSLGAAIGPTVTGFLAAHGLFDWAFYLAGGIKILYDLLLLWSFSAHRAEHEAPVMSTAQRR